MLAAQSDMVSLLIFLVVFLVAFAVLKELVRPGKSKRRYFRRRPGYDRSDLRVVAKPGEDEALATASEQLRRVMAADYKARALLNRPEALVF